MEDMSKSHRSLATTKGKDNSRRAKPLVSKAGVDRKRTPYKYGGKS